MSNSQNYLSIKVFYLKIYKKSNDSVINEKSGEFFEWGNNE